MLRPARVRMRSRKPCTLWRRRLFGWYVRLLTRSLRWWSGTVTPAAARSPVGDRQRWSNAGPWFGASAGTAHPRSGGTTPGTSPGGAWTCGTRRHRVTDERYAWRSLRRQIEPRHRRPSPGHGADRPSRAPRTTGSADLQQPVDSVLLGPRTEGYVRASSSFPAFRSDQGPTATAPGGQMRDTWPLTCGDPVLHRSTVSVSAGRFHKETVTFTRCGQTCGTRSASGPRTRVSATTGTATMRAGQPLWTTTRIWRPRGSEWWRSCSPTNRPGSKPVSRSPCTATPRSSRSPTTSPGPSSRAGSGVSSRMR